MSRGDRREDIFFDDSDRELFLKTLGETCLKTKFQIHAWCLMRNHFHLVLETPQPNLVPGMKWLLSTYTARFNRKHKYFGHLFSGRYKAVLISGSPGYLRTACNYVHLNPVRARLLRSHQPLSDYPWSSYAHYLKPPRQRPPWLRTDRLFGEFHLAPETSIRRRQLDQHMEKWRANEEQRDYKPFRRGWFFGEDQLKDKILELISDLRTPAHYGQEIQESEEQRARRLLKTLLRENRWTESTLRSTPKGDPIKIKIAQTLRQQTTVTIPWIAAHLHMGTPGHLTHLLYWTKRGKKPPMKRPKPQRTKSKRTTRRKLFRMKNTILP